MTKQEVGVHEYSVGLLIAGEDLDQSEVTRKLGLQPSVSLRKGERVGVNRRRRQSIWSFDVLRSPDDPDWRSLDDGLKCLIDKLVPLKSVLHELRQRYSTEAYCGHFGSGFGGGPSISPDTLRLLADLGLTLTIKTYWGEDQPDLGVDAGEHGSPNSV